MKILHVSPAFFPAISFGGPIIALFSLCKHLSLRPEIDIIVVTTDSRTGYSRNRFPALQRSVNYNSHFTVEYYRSTLGEEFSVGVSIGIAKRLRWASVVHLTGFYSLTAIPTILLCGLFGKPLVWSPRGALLALMKWNVVAAPIRKRIWNFVMRRFLPKRTIFHVTSEEERRATSSIMSQYRSVLIPNGVDPVQLTQKRSWRPSGYLRILYLGRIHPVKGLENLINALTSAGLEAARLSIYGTGDAGYINHLKALVVLLGLSDRVVFLGEISRTDISVAFSLADLTVLPSYSENFGMAVAESLMHGVPVIASTATPWEKIATIGCGLWIDNSVESLAKGLLDVAAMDLSQMGRLGREWMLRDYSWNVISEDFVNLYQDLIDEQR